MTLLVAAALSGILSGCGPKAAPPAATPPAAKAVPVDPNGTAGVGVSPSNTISQKEQAAMSAEKTAGGK